MDIKTILETLQKEIVESLVLSRIVEVGSVNVNEANYYNELAEATLYKVFGPAIAELSN